LAKQRAAILGCAACVTTRGVGLPKPSFSGRASVSGGTVNETTITFSRAPAGSAHFRTFPRSSGASGAGGPGGA
jgi:hypothetical protein